MLFPTLDFALFFLVVFGISWEMRHRPEPRKVFLLGASYFFYGYWDWRFTALLAGSSLINYAAGRLIGLSANEREKVENHHHASITQDSGARDATNAGKLWPKAFHHDFPAALHTIDVHRNRMIARANQHHRNGARLSFENAAIRDPGFHLFQQALFGNRVEEARKVGVDDPRVTGFQKFLHPA